MTHLHTPTSSHNSALLQLARTFGSNDELLELFDDLMHRFVLAYANVAPEELHLLVGDYDFLHQLKQAVKQDLQLSTL
jgi:hypothetical protein